MLTTASTGKHPVLRVHYRDPDEGWEGILVVDSLVKGVALGGMRVSRTVDLSEVMRLARGMTLKNGFLGIDAGGAKVGIRYDPRSPGKQRAIRRFLEHVRPMCESMYSIGPDMNTTVDEIDRAVVDAGLTWRLAPMVRDRGRVDEAHRRYSTAMAVPTGPFTFGATRTGIGAAAAVDRARRFLGLSEPLRVAIHGFGAVGLGTAWALEALHDHRVVAVADEGGTYADERGLDVLRLAESRRPGDLRIDAKAAGAVRTGPSESVLSAPCDVLVLASVPDAVSHTNANEVKAPLVVEAGNLGVTASAAVLLHARGTWVVPDFIASGGAAVSCWMLVRGHVPHDDADRLVAGLGQHIGDATERALELARERRLPIRHALLPTTSELELQVA